MKPVKAKKIVGSLLLISAVTYTSHAQDEISNTPLNSPRSYNLRPSESSENLSWVLGNSKKLSAPISSAALPTKWDFSHQIPLIHNQGALGSCSAQAITLSMELSLAKNNIQTQLSPLYVYYNERAIAGSVNYDSGATLSDGIKAICTWGSCKEATWSYDDYLTKFKVKPSQEAYTEGDHLTKFGGIVTNHVNYDMTTIKYVLSQNIPIIFGIYVYPSFESIEVSRTGKVPMPAPYEQPLGGHALTLIGYNDETQEVKFANSWGKSWGDNGCGYLSYKYVMNEGTTGMRPYFFPYDLWSINSQNPKLNNTKIETKETL